MNKVDQKIVKRKKLQPSEYYELKQKVNKQKKIRKARKSHIRNTMKVEDNNE